ncbi:MAG: hypothetical protein ISS18_16175 [Bacteroidales bacterium]|nr:hypothetical protein [Bacteroidales bacterium]
MKKVALISMIGLMMIALLNPTVAQQTKKEKKDLKKELKAKADKQARKDAKKYKKDGYYVAPGALPMEKQLENAWLKQLETDEHDYPKYIVATGNSVGETQTAAKLQATETAKLELAGTITTDVAALIETNIANQQLNNEEAASVTKTVAAAKNIIAQELGRIIPMVEMYKKIGKNVEANVRLAYDSKTAKEAAKKVIRKQLEEETDLMQDKLDKLLDF